MAPPDPNPQTGADGVASNRAKVVIALLLAASVAVLAVVAHNALTDQRPSADERGARPEVTPLPVGATPLPYEEQVEEEIKLGQPLGRVPSGVTDAEGVERVLGDGWDCYRTGRPMGAGARFFVCDDAYATEEVRACDVTLTANGDVVKGDCYSTLPEGGSGGD